MAKGSQLTQLKSALSKAGIVKPPESSKKRKRAQNEEKDRAKRASRLREIHDKLNPFDVKVTKVKKDVGGRKLKGVTGRPALSKQAGIEQRKKTLLKEFEDRSHAGGIVDRRFGENDPTMAPEERMLERFTRERQRASKGTAFNLEEEEELTHYGQSLSKLDDFDNTGFTLDDEEDAIGQIDSNTVERAHFGGFGDDDAQDEDPDHKKSKAEVMAEVIAKSKEHKLQRQMEREKDDSIRHELDQELDSIRSLLLKPDALSASLEQSNALATSAATEKDQEYDQFIRELVFDKRARPKDRLKTEEELALEEKERLEKAERKRIRRMNGEDDVDSGDDDTPSRKRKRSRGGDDLEDDFMDSEEWGGLGTGLHEGSEESGADSDDSDDDADDAEGEVGSEEDSEEDSGDEEVGEDSEEHDISSKRERTTVRADNDGGIDRPAKRQRTSAKELPFTFPCPSSHEEFLVLLENVADNDVPTVVQRIRALYHPSLGVDNKFKLQTFIGVLIDHILHVASPPAPRFSLVSALVPHIYALTKAYPVQSAEHFSAKLSIMSKNLRRGVSRGATKSDSKTWPRLPELALLRTIGAIWPTSDMNHAVISPARLLMGSFLGLCRIRSLQDLASGLFLCTLFLQYEQLSRRLVPEAINLLENALLHLAPHRFTDTQSLPGCFSSPDFEINPHGLKLDSRAAKECTPRPPQLDEILAGVDDGTQTRVDLLGLSVDLLLRFAHQYKDLEGFVELYQPCLGVLNRIDVSLFSQSLRNKFDESISAIQRLLKFGQQGQHPLRLQAHKPIPIPSYIPKFESTSSSYLRAQDPDHEKTEASKLRKQYKQERKGAIRELRKDARFLASVEQEKQKVKDRAYAESMKKVFGSLESERAEERALEREKAREKRRAGKK